MRILALSLISLITTTAQAQLSEADLARELAYTGLHVIDWAQSRNIAQSPKDWYEKNLVLGRHPSRSKVDTYMAGSLAAHWAITYALPKDYRPAWQYSTIAIEAYCVGRNYRVGISARF